MMTITRAAASARRLIPLALLALGVALLLSLLVATPAQADEDSCGAPAGWGRMQAYEDAVRAMRAGQWPTAEAKLKEFLLCNGPRLLDDSALAQRYWADLHCFMHGRQPNSGKECTHSAPLQPQSAGVGSEGSASGAETTIGVGGNGGPGCNDCQWDLNITWLPSDQAQTPADSPYVNDISTHFLPTSETILPLPSIYKIELNFPFYITPAEWDAGDLLIDPAGDGGTGTVLWAPAREGGTGAVLWTPAIFEGETESEGGGTLTPLTPDPGEGHRIICRGGDMALRYLFDRAAFEITLPAATSFASALVPVAAGELAAGACVAPAAAAELRGARSFVADPALFDAGAGLVMERGSTDEWRVVAPALLEQLLDDEDLFVAFQLVVDANGEVTAIAAETITSE